MNGLRSRRALGRNTEQQIGERAFLGPSFAGRQAPEPSQWDGSPAASSLSACTCLASCRRLSSPASSRPCRSRSCCALRACRVTSRRSLASSAAVSSSSSSVTCARRSLAICSAARRDRSCSCAWWGWEGELWAPGAQGGGGQDPSSILGQSEGSFDGQGDVHIPVCSFIHHFPGS